MEKKIIRKIILAGAGGSGKDYAKSLLINFGFASDISHTTRLPRHGETAGKDYHFISEKQFLEKIFKKEFIQWNFMGSGYCYGTLMTDWDSCNLFIMTPNVIDTIKEFYKNKGIEEDFIVMYFDILEGIRKERLLARPNSTERSADDRIAFDSELFHKYNGYDEVVVDPNFRDIKLLDKIFSNPKYDASDLLRSIKGNK